jgi:predicted dehydrogenase
MVKDIGIGVVGLGMGRNVLHVNALADSRLTVRGICDTDVDRLTQVAGEHDIDFATADYDALLGRDGIDIIGVYTPDALHCEQILAALDAGKHVVATKPMVNTVEEAEAVVAAVRRTGLKLLVGETVRFNVRNMAAKALVDSGRIGDPLFVEAHYVHDMRPVIAKTPWRDDPLNKRFLVGSACHPIDHVMWFGGEVAEVSAFGQDSGLLEGRVALNNFVLNLTFTSGAIGRVLGLYGVVHPPLPMEGFGICCTRGSIAGPRYTVDSPEGVTEHELEVAPDPYAGHGGQTVRYMKHLEDCIVHDKEPMVDAVQGARTTAVSYAALESIETGRSVVARMVF